MHFTTQLHLSTENGNASRVSGSSGHREQNRKSHPTAPVEFFRIGTRYTMRMSDEYPPNKTKGKGQHQIIGNRTQRQSLDNAAITRDQTSINKGARKRVGICGGDLSQVGICGRDLLEKSPRPTLMRTTSSAGDNNRI